MFTIKRTNPLTINAKIALPLDGFFVALFIMPLFMVMPEWYLTLETIVGMIVVFFMAIGTSSLVFMLWSNSLPKSGVKFFTKEQILSWFVAGAILTSMFIQEMDTLFSLYLILVATTNVVKYMWLKK